MAITQNDLEILKSEIMADTPDGGGLPTGIAVIDGVSNNLFPDVSDIDRLIGRVRLRKVSLAVKTANADLLQAPRMLFTELPDNPNISVFAFKASSFADRRSDAQNAIESYLTFGARTSGHLLETQLEGQRIIQLSLDMLDYAPKVANPLVLVQNEGAQDEYYQYIRPIKISKVVRIFQKSGGESVKRVVATIEFSEPLGRTFTGLTVSEFYSNLSTARRAILREAQVSDAAKYYSASKLAEPIVAMTTQEVRVKSTYVNVVPSATTETALPLLDPVGQSKTLVRSSSGLINIDRSIPINPSTPWQVGSGIYPSSMSLSINGIYMTDKRGELKDSGNTAYASIDYNSGRITWYQPASFGIQRVMGGFAPAGAVMRVMQTELMTTPETGVGSSYIKELQAPPTRGSMQVSFQVGGRVQIIRDDSKGALIDSDGGAYGILDYENKLAQLTLPAIPDTLSAIIFTYSTELGIKALDEPELPESPFKNLVIKGGFNFSPLYYIPPSATITWDDQSAIVADNIITGDATGVLGNSLLRIIPNKLPAKGTVFTATYQTPVSSSEAKSGSGTSNAAVSGSDNIFSFTIGKFDPGTLDLRVKVKSGTWSNSGGATLPDWDVSLKDDGISGIKVLRFNGANNISTVTKDLVFDISGTIDYASGLITLKFNASAKSIKIATSVVSDPRYKYFKAFDAKIVKYSNVYTPITANPTSISFDYSASAITGSTKTEVQRWTANDLVLELPDDTNAPILPSSVALLGATDNNGIMLKDGSTVGGINYQNGIVTLTDWSPKPANDIVVDSAVNQYGVPALASIIFRTANAPIKIGTLSINLVANGISYRATANEDGIIGVASADGSSLETSYLDGFIDYQSGVVAIYAENIDPESVNYTAMSYSYLPLDKELIGLDPVRLPTDGRVPFVRKGDSIAITELKTMQLPTNAPNDIFDLGFERLSDVNVIDSIGKKVSFDYLDIDLDAGTLQLNGAFDISLYTAPLTAKYRIMDIALVIETDISGRVTLSTPITHDYSTAAVFSSMLLAGDMQARAFNVFGQKSWGGVWSDTLVGDATTSQLQVTNNPIVVTNRDAIEERWALVFTSQTAFNIIGQTVGQIGTGSTTTLTAPINPMTGYPYFTIPAAAWGTGWSANNVVRINTAAAKYPVWIGNAIQQHQGSSSDNYDFTIGYHANIDRERGVA